MTTQEKLYANAMAYKQIQEDNKRQEVIDYYNNEIIEAITKRSLLGGLNELITIPSHLNRDMLVQYMTEHEHLKVIIKTATMLFVDWNKKD